MEEIGEIRTEERIQVLKFSGKLQCIYEDGTIQYDNVIGTPQEFPLTEFELIEVNDAINAYKNLV